MLGIGDWIGPKSDQSNLIDYEWISPREEWRTRAEEEEADVQRSAGRATYSRRWPYSSRSAIPSTPSGSASR